jgi:hypothetical protein
MAPFPGAVVNLWLKEDVVGNEVGVGGAVLDAFVPLQFEQVYETLKEHGWTEGTALSALGFFGVGINTYGPNTPVERARAALGRLEVLEDAKATTAADRGLLARLRAFESQRRRLEAAIKAREESGRDATRLREQLDEAAERAMR